jgi:hypothetical protein
MKALKLFIITYLVNPFKDGLEYGKIKSTWMYKTFTTTIFLDGEIPIYVSSEWIRFLTRNYTRPAIAAFCLRMLADNKDVILVPDEFHQWSETLRQFILSHEYGHIQCSHNSFHRNFWFPQIKRLWNIIILNKVMEDELEADNFAIMVCGKETVIQALRELQVMFGKGLAHKELDLRIQHAQGSSLEQTFSMVYYDLLNLCC